MLEARLGHAERDDRSHRRQRGDASSGLDRAGHQRSSARTIRGAHADIEAGSIEQVAHRDDQALRQQQHVEEERANRRHAEHTEGGACRLTHEASPCEPERVHRRARRSALRRSSAHDAATVATAPRGTAIARQSAATSGVMRTKISAVS